MLIYRKKELNERLRKEGITSQLLQLPKFLREDMEARNLKLEEERELYDRVMNELDLILSSPECYNLENEMLKEKLVLNLTLVNNTFRNQAKMQRL